MPLTVTEKETLLARRKGLVDDARAEIQLSREATNGEPTDEAIAASNKILDEADKIYAQIQDDERASARAAATNDRLNAAEATLRQGTGRRTSPAAGAGIPLNSGAVEMAFGRHRMTISRDRDMARRNTDEYSDAFASMFGNNRGPQAAVQLDDATGGGVLAPPRFVADLIKELDAMMRFRQIAKVLPPGTARELSYPRRTVRERRMQKGQVWTPPAGTDAKLGMATWTLHPFTGESQVNKSLIAFAALDVQAFIRGEINYDIAATQEQLFMTGTGNQEPHGVFTDALTGLSSVNDSADVTVALDYNGVCDWKFQLRDVYLASGSLYVLCHRNFQKALVKIRTTDGIPLFQPSLRVGEPDLCLGVPMMFSEFAPAGNGANGTYNSGDYAACMGDFSNYWIYESSDFGIEIHDLDTRANLKSFLYRTWFDGNFRMREAFKRLKKA